MWIKGAAVDTSGCILEIESVGLADGGERWERGGHGGLRDNSQGSHLNTSDGWAMSSHGDG